MRQIFLPYANKLLINTDNNDIILPGLKHIDYLEKSGSTPLFVFK